jgi:hypothetical protein
VFGGECFHAGLKNSPAGAGGDPVHASGQATASKVELLNNETHDRAVAASCCDPVEQSPDLIGDVASDAVLQGPIVRIALESDAALLKIGRVSGEHSVEFAQSEQHGPPK